MSNDYVSTLFDGGGFSHKCGADPGHMIEILRSKPAQGFRRILCFVNDSYIRLVCRCVHILCVLSKIMVWNAACFQ